MPELGETLKEQGIKHIKEFDQRRSKMWSDNGFQANEFDWI